MFMYVDTIYFVFGTKGTFASFWLSFSKKLAPPPAQNVDMKLLLLLVLLVCCSTSIDTYMNYYIIYINGLITGPRHENVAIYDINAPHRDDKRRP